MFGDVFICSPFARRGCIQLFTTQQSSRYDNAKNNSLSAFLTIPGVLGHMEMSYPYPFKSSYNPKNNYTNIDYSMTTPLNADPSNFPCKGYHTVISSGNCLTVDTITAGQSYTVKFLPF